jgi:hypothetical protein
MSRLVSDETLERFHTEEGMSTEQETAMAIELYASRRLIREMRARYGLTLMQDREFLFLSVMLARACAWPGFEGHDAWRAELDSKEKETPA